MNENTGLNEDRLCCVGECYRNEVIQDFEAEWNDIVHPEMQWGPQDIYMRHKGFFFYYKPRLLALYEEDQKNHIEELTNNVDVIRQSYTEANDYLGYVFDDRKLDPSLIVEIIKAQSSGLPRYVGHSTNFYKFEDVWEQPITIDDMTAQLLQQIKNTFTGDYNPLLGNVANGLCKKGDKIYFTDITKWTYNPSPKGKLGVFFDPSYSAVYEDAPNKIFFFPFRPLTAIEQKFVENVAKNDTDYTTVQIINL